MIGPCSATLFKCSTSTTVQIAVRTNAWRSSIGKMGREPYLRRYPVTIVQPDGSSFEIRYLEPRETVALAVDLKSLSADERRQRLAARKPKAKLVVAEKIDDNFNEADYMQFFTSGAEQSKSQQKRPDQAIRKQEKKFSNTDKATKVDKKEGVADAKKPLEKTKTTSAAADKKIEGKKKPTERTLEEARKPAVNPHESKPKKKVAAEAS